MTHEALLPIPRLRPLRSAILVAAAWFAAPANATAASLQPAGLHTVNVRLTGLQLEGRIGFMGEWGLSATLKPDTSALGVVYAGVVTMRHVGLCSTHGPEEQSGKITMASMRKDFVTDLALSYGTEACSFTGPLSRSASGIMRCNGGPDIPAHIWLAP